jgi:hypothetical protein
LAYVKGQPNLTHIVDALTQLLALPPMGEFERTPDALDLWKGWYQALNFDALEDRLKASQERIRPNTLRTALIYALIDPDRIGGRNKTEILPKHVEAAIEIARYSRDSIDWFLKRPARIKRNEEFEIFTKIRLAANKSGGQLTGKELHDVLSHYSPEQRAELATRAGLKFRRIKNENRGRSLEVWTW